MIQSKKELKQVRKFYLLEYFYTLLCSIEKYDKKESVFNYFKELSAQHHLGRSKYKKLSSSTGKMPNYNYSFNQVLAEAKDYDLISEKDGRLAVERNGNSLLIKYKEDGLTAFNDLLLRFIEDCYQAFFELIPLMYETGKEKEGLWKFPHWSPSTLGLSHEDLRNRSAIIEYSKNLKNRLKQEIKSFDQMIDEANASLIGVLERENLLPKNDKVKVDSKTYRRLIDKFKPFWTEFLLKNVYQYKHGMSSFENWIYRGKQIGIIHATEFYPGFKGKWVYPTALISDKDKSADFKKLHTYPNKKYLYIHRPIMNKQNLEIFIESLLKSYVRIRDRGKNYFIGLHGLRERVCYDLKICEQVFSDFLNEIYRLQLKEELSIKISLEADRPLEEAKAAYLIREPVKIDGKPKNTIAIDLTKTR